MTQKLKFKLGESNLEILLSKKEQESFSNESTFLNKSGHEWLVKDSFFNDSTRVEDVFRYYLKYEKDSGWCFYDNENRKKSDFCIKNDSKELISSNEPVIVLILESPHKDEYEIKNGELIPRSPAAGDSGRAIHNYFTSHVLPILINLGLKLEFDKEYKFYIVNPVPYQTSMVNIHQEGLISSLRDKVWEKMYPILKQDFVERLKKYKPTVILNGCTSNLKEQLKPELLKLEDTVIFNVNHPASWQRALSGFKIQENN